MRLAAKATILRRPVLTAYDWLNGSCQKSVLDPHERPILRFASIQKGAKTEKRFWRNDKSRVKHIIEFLS
jgi:hypothetical protein